MDGGHDLYPNVTWQWEHKTGALVAVVRDRKVFFLVVFWWGSWGDNCRHWVLFLGACLVGITWDSSRQSQLYDAICIYNKVI